jgi:A/G-specific adenine glycosylase
VIPYYHRFLKLFPTVVHLADADEQQVLKAWEGLGYYSRGRNLHQASRRIRDEFGGRIPLSQKDFRSLPGVGPYICAAVLSICAGQPLPVVDGNVLRVVSRFHMLEDEIDKGATRTAISRELADIIPASCPGDFNQAMMELGALVCTARRPLCLDCPLARDCLARKKGLQDQLPRRSAKRRVPTYRVSVAIIVRGNRIFIQKRPSSGHLGGLWEFPGGKGQGRESVVETLNRECLEELGVRLQVIKELQVVKHAYTHFKIELHPFICGLQENHIPRCADTDCRWVTLDELKDHPFPQANHKIFPELRRFLAPSRKKK